jgi:DNA-binding transcriptional LysR family regulator
MEDEMVLITPSDFEFDRLIRDQLLSVNLLMREQGSGSRRVVETALEKAGFKLKSFKSVMNLDSTEAIKSAVEAGLGIGFVSRWAISKELELRLLKVVEVTGLRITRHFSLVSRAGPEASGAAGAFREFALARARILSSAPKQPNRSRSANR